MAKDELAGVVIAHADGREGVERRELVLPELGLPTGRTAVGAVKVDVGERRCRAILGSIGRPFVGVDGLGRAFARIVVAGHEGEDIFEVLDGSNAGAPISAVGVNQLG